MDCIINHYTHTCTYQAPAGLRLWKRNLQLLVPFLIQPSVTLLDIQRTTAAEGGLETLRVRSIACFPVFFNETFLVWHRPNLVLGSSTFMVAAVRMGVAHVLEAPLASPYLHSGKRCIPSLSLRFAASLVPSHLTGGSYDNFVRCNPTPNALPSTQYHVLNPQAQFVQGATDYTLNAEGNQVSGSVALHAHLSLLCSAIHRRLSGF